MSEHDSDINLDVDFDRKTSSSNRRFGLRESLLITGIIAIVALYSNQCCKRKKKHCCQNYNK